MATATQARMATDTMTGHPSISHQRTIDGRHVSWQAFARRLETLAAQDDAGGAGLSILPPHGCEAAAARLIADLDLGDHVELVMPSPAPPRPRLAASIVDRFLAALLSPRDRSDARSHPASLHGVRPAR